MHSAPSHKLTEYKNIQEREVEGTQIYSCVFKKLIGMQPGTKLNLL